MLDNRVDAESLYYYPISQTSSARANRALQEKNIDKFYSKVKILSKTAQKEIASSILTGVPLSDVYKFYQDRFNQEVTTTKNLYNMYTSKYPNTIESEKYKQKLELLGTNGIE